MTRTDARHGRLIRAVAAVFITVILFGTLAGCDRLPGFGSQGEAQEEGQEASQPAVDGRETVRGENVGTVFAINVTPAVEGPISDYIEINGDVDTTASVDAYSDAAGEVVRLYVGIGQRVTEGQRIAEVDPSRPGQNFTLSPVTAPISGTVTRLPIRVGSRVNQSTPVAQISRTNELEIIVNVAERFVSKIRTGLPAVVRLDAFPDREFSAVVSELNPVVDPLTRTLEVKLRFTSSIQGVRPGMYAEVRIVTERKDNIVKVPADVLIRRFGEDFVFVVKDDNTVERRTVNPGIEIDNIMEITAGLEAGELVVYQGQNLLEDGVSVRIIDTVEPLGQE